MSEKPPFRIPPGYQTIEAWKEAHPDEKPAKEVVRWRGAIGYVLDPENPEYRAFSERCKEDTRSFEKALRKELRARNLPVWSIRIPKRAYSKDYREMGFLIRPPFFTSTVAKDETNRMQPDDDKDIFALHFDEEHSLQEVRHWKPQAVGYSAHYVTALRSTIHNELLKDRDFFSEHYGEWDAMAGKVCDILETIKIADRVEQLNSMKY
jgi:hypothetical protein